MKNTEIKTLTEYLTHVKGFEQQHIAQWFFRGVRKEHYPLEPSLFRLNIKNTLLNWKDLEENMMGQFQRESRPYLDHEPKDDFEWLVLAQHYGLPTRLLDWTTNQLIALFFAIEKYDEQYDSAVWCFGFPSTHNCHPESTRIDRRLTLEKDKLILFPDHISPRITNQSACFTIHQLPSRRDGFVPFNEQPTVFGLFEKITIGKKHKKNLMNELYDLGFHSGLVYPGLDGISKRIKQEASTTHSRSTNPNQIKRLFKNLK